MGETVIVYFLDDLINICKQANEDPRLLILAVQLLSPKRINQTNNWKLEELREVWRYSDDMDDQITFVTTGGERRNWGRQTMAKDFSKTAKLIWEMPT
ncbi:hypothetical protein SAMN06295970_1561 [Noviherbaspirillum suwonense]|uniref:Uncharacterized protein n=2 Tax=Noviherbaspirillum suwonense TaxID=1224511 RepID=A0ABY1QZK5_9BURK|nr:hypothetical protein SAMN06295970_1561 [Noviherbaspirillum suwonense]